MNEANLQESFRWNERIATFVKYLLVSLMMASLAVSVVQLGEYLQPEWNGDYLVLLCFFAASESLYSQRLVRNFGILSKEWFLFRSTEWLLYIVGIKLFLYTIHNFEGFWLDLSRWDQEFVDNFVDGEYLFTMIVVVLIWFLSNYFGEQLLLLEGDEKLLEMERDSYILEQRPAARRSLSNLILTVGGVMIFEGALVRLDWEVLWGGPPPLRGDVFNILIYFILALILLSLTQLSILRVGWSLDRIPVSRNIASRWIIYSALFLAVVGAVALLLPTRYSIGLLELIGFLIDGFISIILTVILLISLPFVLLFSLIANLFGQSQSLNPMNIQEVMPPPAQPPTGSSLPEFIKSLIFWSIFLTMIGYSLYYYFGKNKELIVQIKELKFLQALRRFFSPLWNWIRGVNKNIAKGVESGLKRLRESRKSLPVRAPRRLLNLRRLDPRQKVYFYYSAMIRRGKEHGLPRNADQTPYEYADFLRSELTDVETDISAITDEFVEARYSRHEITATDASFVQNLWRRIKKAMRTSSSSKPS